MRVFLIHGMARTRLSMAVLAGRLWRAGHRPSLFGYSVQRHTLEHIVERFADRIEEVMAAAPGAPYAVVGHSLGNVITRLASPRLPPGFARFVMLAPPNQPPALARALGGNPIFRLAFGDAGDKLKDDGFFARIPVPEVPSLIIAGTRGPRASWLPFGGAANDAILRLEETRLGDLPLVTVHAAHTFLMNRREVFVLVRDFLDRGLEAPSIRRRLTAHRS
ncbi:MAG: alpha/beta hydrolase [Acidobacteria bacterium]|nr:MAG: alpha/beta hydrolase [Acidobacteriota bacterium]